MEKVKENRDFENLGKERRKGLEEPFIWKDYGEHHAVLYNGDMSRVEAEVTMDYGCPELMDGFWKVIISRNRELGFKEENTGLPMADIKRRTMIRLGDYINKKRDETNQDRDKLEKELSCILKMLFREEGKACDEGQ